MITSDKKKNQKLFSPIINHGEIYEDGINFHFTIHGILKIFYGDHLQNLEFSLLLVRSC